MITEISFKNFKCLSDKEPFTLQKINVFSGYNGRGKSSVMQFLLMLSQSVRKDQNLINKLHLNGDYVSLGDFDEIMTDDKVADVTIKFKTDDASIKEVILGYELSDEDYRTGFINNCIINGVDFFDTPQDSKGDTHKEPRKKVMVALPNSLGNLFRNIYYVSANRQGPVKYEDRQEVPDFLNVGAFGDHTINTLASYKGRINEIMNPPGITGKHSLQEQVSLWLSYLMRDGKIRVNDIRQEKHRNAVLSLDFNFHNFKKSFNSYNVGFGYSYILSIVVTALIARPGTIVVIENPEAHLHPEAQLRLTELLSRLAGNNVQVFIETHSEHILNGFRIAALKNDAGITSDNLSLYFFDMDFTIQKLRIKPNGRIPNWPKRFFDQYEDEMATIIRLGKEKK